MAPQRMLQTLFLNSYPQMNILGSFEVEERKADRRLPLIMLADLCD